MAWRPLCRPHRMRNWRAARLPTWRRRLRRAPRPWMFASSKFPYLWDAFFAVQRGESTYAREAARVPLLPGIAQRMLDRE